MRTERSRIKMKAARQVQKWAHVDNTVHVYPVDTTGEVAIRPTANVSAPTISDSMKITFRASFQPDSRSSRPSLTPMITIAANAS
jgi:hypothetical protein